MLEKLADGNGNFQSLEECEAVEDSWVNDANVDPMEMEQMVH